MFLEIIIIGLIVLYFFLEAYQLRYFFETNYMVTEISSNGISCKKSLLRKQFPEITINWSDITSAKLIQGFDSSRWLYQNVKKKLGLGIYTRLVLKTRAQGTFVFHITQVPTIRPLLGLAEKISAFNKNGEMLEEIRKHSIPLEETERSLLDAMTNKEDRWYKND